MGKTFLFFGFAAIFFPEKFKTNLSSKVKNLYSTYDRESSEKSHRATDC